MREARPLLKLDDTALVARREWITHEQAEHPMPMPYTFGDIVRWVLLGALIATILILEVSP